MFMRLFLISFILAYVLGTHLNCIDKSMQFKWVPTKHAFELHQQIDAIQIGTRNICFYKEVNKKYTGCNLKTTELLDCTLLQGYVR